MRRIDDRTVELTDREMAASITFEELLDQGHSIGDALPLLTSRYPRLSRHFLDYLAY